MEPKQITILSFGYFDRGFIEKISEAVRYEYQCSIINRELHIDLSEYYDPGRKQYNGDKLLKQVNAYENAESGKVIGLFNVDIFIPILTYIFGQAQLGGKCGIASVYRLENELYGLKRDDNLTLERFKKEVIHELGHSFGLKHCHDPSCVMHASTYVEDIDLKESHLCMQCRQVCGI